MFTELKTKLKKNFSDLVENNTEPLFYIDIDKVWEEYLSGFDEPERQVHNCNSCKSFLRQYAGIVAIRNNKVISIWDNMEDLAEYTKSVEKAAKAEQIALLQNLLSEKRTEALGKLSEEDLLKKIDELKNE